MGFFSFCILWNLLIHEDVTNHICSISRFICGHNLLLCRVLAQLLLKALQANFCQHFDSLKSYMLYIVIWSLRIYCCNTLLCLKSKSLILGLVASTMKEVSSSIWNNPRYPFEMEDFTRIGLEEQIKWTLNNIIWVNYLLTIEMILMMSNKVNLKHLNMGTFLLLSNEMLLWKFTYKYILNNLHIKSYMTTCIMQWNKNIKVPTQLTFF